MQGKFGQKVAMWKMAMSQKKYLITFSIVLVLFYVLNATMAVSSRIKYSKNIFDIIALYTQGVYQTLGIVAFTGTVVVSILTAFLFALLLFRATITKTGMDKKLSTIGYLGLFFGFFVSGCPTCGLGLLAILGLGASVLALPFKGVEISIIAIIILLAIINQVTNRILFCKMSDMPNHVKR